MINLRVLFADDEPDIREIIDLSLGLDPLFVARGCETGGDALAAAHQWRPDLILLDVVMPGMDGLATLARLRDNRRTAEIPVVFVTARAQDREREHWASLGAAGVISKPFDPMQLPALVRAYVPAEARLAGARDQFLRRLDTDATALAACRLALAQPDAPDTLVRIKGIAHTLANRGAVYGFAGISVEAAELEEAIDLALAGGGLMRVEHVVDRLVARIQGSELIGTPIANEQSVLS
ncbi:MAG: response regulator [Xanthobacteraceae bacterium]